MTIYLQATSRHDGLVNVWRKRFLDVDPTVSLEDGQAMDWEVIKVCETMKEARAFREEMKEKTNG